MSLHYDRELDEQCGERDAEAGRPRALGGTRLGYRTGYNRALSRMLENCAAGDHVAELWEPGTDPGYEYAECIHCHKSLVRST